MYKGGSPNSRVNNVSCSGRFSSVRNVMWSLGLDRRDMKASKRTGGGDENIRIREGQKREDFAKIPSKDLPSSICPAVPLQNFWLCN